LSGSSLGRLRALLVEPAASGAYSLAGQDATLTYAGGAVDVRVSWLQLDTAASPVEVRVSWLQFDTAATPVEVRVSWLQFDTATNDGIVLDWIITARRRHRR